MSVSNDSSIVRSLVKNYNYDIEVFNNVTDNVKDFYHVCENIVNLKSFELINNILIDLQTANLFITVYDVIEDRTKEKMQTFFDNGRKVACAECATKALLLRFWRVIKK